ncbi:MAG: R3H domain-containing nucleic acid-binding protein [Candidatus Paceibacterota bacterium]
MNENTLQNIQAVVEELLRTLGVSWSEITVHTEGSRPVIMITSDNAQPLIGTDGSHLQALSTLAHQIVRKTHGPEAAIFSIDVNRYREQAREGLIRKAVTYAKRARSFKSSVALEPMSSYERFVVHEVIGEMSDMATRSEGTGSERHVVIVYTGAH